jgi:hypothetical protein
MRSVSARRAAVTIGAAALALSCAGAALAHPFSSWSGRSGPFAWHARQHSCGVAGGKPSTLREHTRWRTSPANGYHRLIFRHQVKDEATGKWQTIKRRRWSTRNTRLEGNRRVVHWIQRYFPIEDEVGLTTRNVVAFEWWVDRQRDRRKLRRVMTLRACVVQG